MFGAVRQLFTDTDTNDADPTPDLNQDAVAEHDLDDVFEVLGNSRRRTTIRYLVHETDDDTATKRELAGHIAAIENDKPVSDLSTQERKRVYISLHQTHFDTMVDAGIIDYSDRDATVTTTPATHAALRVLEDADRHFTGGDA